ncbi:MAG TPA: alpha/beta fold hydrolase [Actinocrinis sp.]|nr:alpha/beta fold hydrolase [Actinocrinis sp.]
MTPGLTLPPVLDAQFLDVLGAPVAVRRRGAGPPLLYLHGAGMTGKWLQVHEALAAGAEVIAPEHPGCGETPAQDWLRDMGDLVVHYDDLRRALGLRGRFDLVGYSLGGWIAAEFAATFPALVRSLTLIAPIGLTTPQPRLLRRVTCPALVIEAGADRIVPAETVRRYASLLPHARLLVIQGAGHMLVLEQPDTVAGAILTFIRDLTSTEEPSP